MVVTPAARQLVPEVIETRRLTLELLTVEHAEEMVPVLSDPALYAFIGGQPPTLDALRARHEGLVRGPADPNVDWLNWVLRLRESGVVVGNVQVTAWRRACGVVAEVAWVIGVEWQGHGLAKEAVTAVVAWLRRRPVAAVIAQIHPRHAASRAVARAAGLRPTDEMHDDEQIWRCPPPP